MAVTTATDARHDANVDDWKLISKMWTGDRVRTVLNRGAYEAEHAYKKRRKNAQWQSITRDLISRLVGELFSRAGEISRQTVIADEYLDEVGPENRSYGVQLITLAEALVAYGECYAIMDPAEGLRIVEPQHVTRTTDGAVVIKGKRSVGGSVFNDERTEEAWTIYYPNRYETWVRDEDEDEGSNIIAPDQPDERKVDDGFYYREGWSFDGVPAVRVSLPWRVGFGLSVARSHRALYRLRSKYDAALTNSLGGMLQIATGGDDDLAGAIKQALRSGAVAVPYDSDAGEHKALNIGTDGLGPGKEALKRKLETLYRTAYQSLDQASQRMTATEADARTRAGPVAALSVLSETMESAEEQILPLIAQEERPFDASRFGDAEIIEELDWPTDYSHAYDNSDEQLAKMIFGSLGLPSTPELAAEAAAQVYESRGLAPDRDALESEAQRQRDRAEQSPTDESFVS